MYIRGNLENLANAHITHINNPNTVHYYGIDN